MDIPITAILEAAKRGKGGGALPFARQAVTNPARSIGEQMQLNMYAPRPADALYQAFLRLGSMRNGVWKASQTGAYQMARQQLFDKLTNQQLLEQKARREARLAQMGQII